MKPAGLARIISVLAVCLMCWMVIQSPRLKAADSLIVAGDSAFSSSQSTPQKKEPLSPPQTRKSAVPQLKREPSIKPDLTIYVAVDGSDSKDGVHDPVATIEKALSLIDRAKVNVGEIVVRGGTYKVARPIQINALKDHPERKLLIRAANGETPVFDGGQAVAATPLAGEEGIYLIAGAFPNPNVPQVWEEHNRVRYRSVSGLDALRGTDYGVFVYSPTQLAIRPKNGILPPPGELRVSMLEYGLEITRNHVTVDGLSFKGFGKSYVSAGIGVGFVAEMQGLTDNVVIQNCRVENSYSGFYVRRGAQNVTIRSCIIRNVASGINQWGGMAIVDGCDIRNDDFGVSAFAFKNSDAMTGDTGIRGYYNSAGARYRNNTIKGFETGIFIKTLDPQFMTGKDATFIIENNSLIDDPYIRAYTHGKNSWGISFVRYYNYGKDKAVIRHNVIDGFSIPIGKDNRNAKSMTAYRATVDHNLIWNARTIAAIDAYVRFFQDQGMGDANRVADPQFVDRKAGDYRLLPTSPAVVAGWKNPNDAHAVLQPGERYRPSKPVEVSATLQAGNQIPGLSFASVATRANVAGFVVFNPDHQGFYQYVQYRKKGDTAWIQGFDTSTYGSVSDVRMRKLGSQPMVVTGLERDTTYEYQIVVKSSLTDQTREYTESRIFEVKTVGAPVTYHVAPHGVDAWDRGSRIAPLKTLQYALDLALPGDTIRLLLGVYHGASVMVHSGTAEHPITIEAEQPGTAILSADKAYGAVLLLSGVSHVKVKNLNLQWADRAGLSCRQCQAVEIAGNTVLNAVLGSHNRKGQGITIRESTDTWVHHNVIHGWWSGIGFFNSPNTKIEHNTILATSRTGIQIGAGSTGSEIAYNSLNFTGNHALQFNVPNLKYADLKINFNNYGTSFQPKAKSLADADMIFSRAYSFLDDSREFIYSYYPLLGLSSQVLYSFFAWKNATGYDGHSVFADPMWVDPLNNRFDVKAESKNRLPDGDYIGVQGYLTTLQ